MGSSRKEGREKVVYYFFAYRYIWEDFVSWDGFFWSTRTVSTTPLDTLNRFGV
jgi:hypothetical protein